MHDNFHIVLGSGEDGASTTTSAPVQKEHVLVVDPQAADAEEMPTPGPASAFQPEVAPQPEACKLSASASESSPGKTFGDEGGKPLC